MILYFQPIDANSICRCVFDSARELKPANILPANLFLGVLQAAVSRQVANILTWLMSEIMTKLLDTWTTMSPCEEDHATLLSWQQSTSQPRASKIATEEKHPREQR